MMFFFSSVKAAYDALAFVTDLYSKLDTTDTLTVKSIKETNENIGYNYYQFKGIVYRFYMRGSTEPAF